MSETPEEIKPSNFAPEKTKVFIYKLNESIVLPVSATKGSACFDLSYQNPMLLDINGYNNRNRPVTRFVKKTGGQENGNFEILPGDRLLVPTGLIFDMPEDFSLRLYVRSGIALKTGITLANSEGIIDSDYIEPVFMLITNNSEVPIIIRPNDRLCQGEFVKNKNETIEFSLLKEKPFQKSTRNGGFGSTGLKMLDTIFSPNQNQKLDEKTTNELNEGLKASLNETKKELEKNDKNSRRKTEILV